MEAELLAAIYAAPDDDAPRLVYADWLQDRGDPLGELIALQLSGVGGPRADALLAAHGPRILGSLERQIRWGKIRRGFAWSCALLATADPRDPRWATVSHVHGAELLDDTAPLPWLRHLELSDTDIGKLATLARPIAAETLIWHLGDFGYRVSAGLGRLTIAPALHRLEIVDDRRSLPAMERYWRDPREVDWLVASPLAAQLHELALRIDLAHLGAWLARFAASGIRRLELADAGSDPWRVRVARDAAGGLGDLEIRLPSTPPPRDAFSRFGDAMVAGLLSLSRQQLGAARIVGASEATVETVARLERRLQTQTRVRKIVIE